MERTIKVLLILPVIILCLFFNNAQSEEEDNFPDCPKYIGDLNKRGNVKNAADAFDLLLNQDDNIKDSVVSTSFLKEKGKPGDFYAPWKVNDNDKNTAWVEGVKGDGIGEKFYLELFKIDRINFFNPILKIEVINGFAQSNKLYLLNNRLKNLKLTFLYANFDICGGYYSERKSKLSALNSKIIELKDSSELQEIVIALNSEVIKKNKNNSPIYIVLEVEILSVYKGTKYDDTCISEFNVKDIIEEGKKIK